MVWVSSLTRKLLIGLYQMKAKYFLALSDIQSLLQLQARHPIFQLLLQVFKQCLATSWSRGNQRLISNRYCGFSSLSNLQPSPRDTQHSCMGIQSRFLCLATFQWASFHLPLHLLYLLHLCPHSLIQCCKPQNFHWASKIEFEHLG